MKIDLMDILVWLVIVAVPAALVLIADYKQAQGLHRLVEMISEDPTYLQSPQNREVCSLAVGMISMSGPFTLREVAIIRKALSA